MVLLLKEVQIGRANEKYTEDAVMIQEEYGKYLFDEIFLKESRNSYFESLQGFPSATFQRPNGVYFVAYDERNNPVGAIGLGRVDESSCEMRRFYVLPQYRGNGAGKFLAESIISEAKNMNYKRMYLETQPEMAAAIRLYNKFGFVAIPPYCKSEDPSTVHFALEL